MENSDNNKNNNKNNIDNNIDNLNNQSENQKSLETKDNNKNLFIYICLLSILSASLLITNLVYNPSDKTIKDPKQVKLELQVKKYQTENRNLQQKYVVKVTDNAKAEELNGQTEILNKIQELEQEKKTLTAQIVVAKESLEYSKKLLKETQKIRE